MADGNAASPSRNRLARRRPEVRPKRPEERPEVALARNLINTEYGLRGRRPGTRARSRDTESAWEQLADELRRFMDRLRGRSPSQSASAGGAPSSAGGQEADSFGQAGRGPGEDGPASARAMAAGPPQSPPSEQSALGGRAGFEGTISQLPRHEREAFEDAVLDLVRNEQKWKKAYDKSPASMPTVAEYANSAYMRELLRGAPPSADPPTRERGLSNVDAPQAVTATEAMNNARDTIMAADAAQFAQLRKTWERDAPRRDQAQVSGPFQEAERARAAWSTANSRNPGMDPMSDGQAFTAVGLAEQLRTNNPPSAAPPSPVSPLLESSSLASPSVQPMLSPEGYDVIRSQQGSSTARNADSPSRSRTSTPVQQSRPSQTLKTQRR
ncbi:hypothetical protein [Streptomyces sp. NPDC060065]|uniref:hypothetical protein n=1 Tax=Streptomyces sp. NPDC060065 TaxID=3347050 RepID=UPI00369ECB1E